MSISPTKRLSMEGVDVEAPTISSELGNLGLEAGDGSSFLPATTPEALFYVLPYLGLKELLTLETVSSQLREAIRGDVTLWQQLHVDVPLNRKLTDAELVGLSSRSHGRLQSLSLIKCIRLSESVIEHIVEANPMLQKLNLSACTGVSAEAVLRMVKIQTERRSPHIPGLTQLRIRGLYGVTPEILESLQRMMQSEGNQSSSDVIPSPHYYKNGEPSPAISEEQLIDIEACPKCRTARLVFDCTRPTCEQRRNIPLQQCRGCYLCIARCEECGVCIDGDDYEETFCMEFLCQSCWLRLPKCSECNRAGCSRHIEALDISETSIFSCDSCQGVLPGDTGPIFD
ncbi:hypothetical protein M758_12G136300 [Ceratodon purpureus]|nr:hypothetical protein M758_12G136300 [Ceratodon purpureus]